MIRFADPKRAATVLTLCLLASACGGDATAPSERFSIQSPLTDIEPGQQTGLCYHFRTPNTREFAVKQWKSKFGLGIARITVVLTSADQQTPGTQTATDCGPFRALSSTETLEPTWAYTAQTPEAQYTFPGNDGTGKPLGMIIPPAQSGFIYIHFLNPTSERLSARVQLEAVPYSRGAAVTGVRSFLTYNSAIHIPPSTTSTFTQSCAVPAGAKFIWMTTYSNKYSTQTSIKDGEITVFQSTDWTNPVPVSLSTPPFFTFGSGALTHTFTYTNTSGAVVDAGDNPATDELAVTLSYFFPATESRYCLNGTAL